jgi:hypothetical protein
MSGSSTTWRAKSEKLVLIPKQLRLDWVDVMACDPLLGPVDYRTASIIGCHVNKHTGYAYLTQVLIAKLSGRCERTIFEAIKNVELRGYLIVKRREFGTIVRKTKSGREVVVRLAGGKGVANMYFPACDGSPVSAIKGSLKLAERCELIRSQRSQEISAKAAADCEPTLSPPTEENPSTSQPSKDEDGLGRLGEVIRRSMKDEVYRAWFGKVGIHKETPSMLILAAPSKFICDRIKQDYEHKFASWCKAIGKEKLQIVFPEQPLMSI